jgi:hypothetical protein
LAALAVMLVLLFVVMRPPSLTHPVVLAKAAVATVAMIEPLLEVDLKAAASPPTPRSFEDECCYKVFDIYFYLGVRQSLHTHTHTHIRTHTHAHTHTHRHTHTQTHTHTHTHTETHTHTHRHTQTHTDT